MAAIAGRVLLLPKGVYNAATTYTLLDFVYYNNASYVCKKTSLGNLPTDDEYWQLLVDVPSAANITPESLGIGYGESTTSATSTAKLATLTDYQLKKNGIVAINFVNNVSAGSTLNINNAGTKPLFYRGAAITDGIIKGGDIATMVYDGTNYDIISIDRAVGNISDLQDVQLTNLAAGDMLVYDSVNHVWVNTQPSPGLLPHIVISSEAQATVTLTKGTTIISVPETSAGVYETDVEEYGTWTATSIKSGQTATVPVVVDTVKIYNVPLQFMSATITVTYPTGTTVTLTGQGESQTATGSPYTFTVHALGTYTVTSVLDGATKINSVTINTDGQTVSLNVQFGTITVNYANEFRGATITCTHDTSTVSKTAPGNANTVDFRVPDLGSWTITASYGGQPYSDTVTVVDYATTVIAELNVVPDGSTVTPTDDVTIWLACGGRNEEYTTLSQVLSDATCLAGLMANNNAVDYLVRSTTWASGIASNTLATHNIGINNYCADTLLADSTWKTALSTTLETFAYNTIFTGTTSFMYSNTSNDGTASTSTYSGSMTTKPYYAFAEDANKITYIDNAIGSYIKFAFSSPKKCIGVFVYGDRGKIGGTGIKIQASDDDNSWIDITDEIVLSAEHSYNVLELNPAKTYSYYRMYVSTARSTTPSGGLPFTYIKYYWREDVPTNITKKTFATATDAEINEMCKWSERGVIDLETDCGWAVGQEHTFTLGAIAASGTFNDVAWSVANAQPQQSVTLVLTRKSGANLSRYRARDKSGDMRQPVAFEYDWKNSLEAKEAMNSTNTNTGSWGATLVRAFCNSGLLQQMLAILPCTCRLINIVTAKTYNGSENESTGDYFALRAEKEIMGARTYSVPTEADALTQAPYYETSANRVKKYGNSGSNAGWYARSPMYNNAQGYIYISSSGTPAGNVASDQTGIAPFGGLG